MSPTERLHCDLIHTAHEERELATWLEAIATLPDHDRLVTGAAISAVEAAADRDLLDWVIRCGVFADVLGSAA